MKLENWSVCAVPAEFDPFKAPELQQPEKRLQGQVYGHPNDRHYDGKWVMTSVPVAHDGVDTVYTKSGSAYILGVIDPKFEEAYPNAKQRMRDSLPRRS